MASLGQAGEAELFPQLAALAVLYNKEIGNGYLSSLSQSPPKSTADAIPRLAVEAEGLVKGYPGGVQPLKGVSIMLSSFSGSAFG